MWSILNTKVFVIVVTVLLVAFDIFLGWPGKENRVYTFSYVISEWARVTPFIPYVYGILAGHFFWTIDNPVIKLPSCYYVLGYSAIVIIAIGLVLRYFGLTISQPTSLAVMTLGVFIGHYLFPI